MIRDAAHMTRDQQNDWYEEKVGYRPDDGEHVEDDELTLQLAEMMFYHADGTEADWAAVDAQALLVFIRADDVANNRSSQQHNV